MLSNRLCEKFELNSPVIFKKNNEEVKYLLIPITFNLKEIITILKD